MIAETLTTEAQSAQSRKSFFSVLSVSLWLAPKSEIRNWESACALN